MTAQQQLAGLLKYGATLPGFQLDCAAFVSNHGPAIAELIEKSIEHARDPDWHTGHEFRDALRKLTQDA